MISYISGVVAEKFIDYVIIENSGVGFYLNISHNSAREIPQVGERLRLFTYLYVREDQLTLYGFNSKDERDLFLTLISISGIGAKGALKILSGITPEKFVEVVASEDVAFLTTLPGIGKKSAQRIIVELREKLPALTADKEVVAGLAKEDAEAVIQALSSLGMTGYESRKAIEKVIEKIGSKTVGQLSTEDMIREVLKAGR
jgi:holliday junction DNA helicase RuvA